MTQVVLILQDAHRESNLVALGANISGDQIAESLRLLNRLRYSVLGYEVGVNLIDYRLSEARSINTTPEYPPANMRVAADSSLFSFLMMPNFAAGARFAIYDAGRDFSVSPLTLQRRDVAIGDAAGDIVINSEGYSNEWIFLPHVNKWEEIQELVENDEWPFPQEFDDFFTTMLAVRLNPRYGRSLSDQTRLTLATSQSRLRARYRQRRAVPLDPALTRLSVQAHGAYGGDTE